MLVNVLTLKPLSRQFEIIRHVLKLHQNGTAQPRQRENLLLHQLSGVIHWKGCGHFVNIVCK